MTVVLNSTHDARRQSWVEPANDPRADFPLTNLPFGVFTTRLSAAGRIGVAIGDQVLDLAAVAAGGLLPQALSPALSEPSLNRLMSLGSDSWTSLRSRLSELLGADTCPAGAIRSAVGRCLIPQNEVTLQRPAQVGDYTDFYASIHHARNVGAMFRPEQPLLPNYQWIPIGYHGRASSLVASGTPVRRPRGQSKATGSAQPIFAPSQQLDYELELAAYVGPANPLGTPVPVGKAEDHIFGVSLLNDWSARDLQSWEYQPLGPFLAKSFASSLSPWIVSFEALAPFRVPAFARSGDDPAPLPYLTDASNQARGGLNITLEVQLRTPAMRRAGVPPQPLSQGNSSSMYWTFAQLVAHHTSNGCNLLPGDLLGSGTVSGADPSSCGCLLELTQRGRQPVTLPGGESRAFLEDGDEVILSGYAERPGFRRIGLGECRGTILPAAD